MLSFLLLIILNIKKGIAKTLKNKILKFKSEKNKLTKQKENIYHTTFIIAVV